MARTPPGPPDIRFVGRGRTRPTPNDRGYLQTYAGAALGMLTAVLAAPFVAGGLDMIAGGMEAWGLLVGLVLTPVLALAAAPVGVAVRLHGRGYTDVRGTVIAMLLLLGALALLTKQVGVIALMGLPGIPAAARAIGRTAGGDPR